MTLILSDTTTDFTTALNPPIILDDKYEYEVGLLNFDTYNSITNIDTDCNKFRYSTDGSITWQDIVIPPGSYEVRAVIDCIESLQNPLNFTFIPNPHTGFAELKTDKVKNIFDFAQPDSIGKILGFNKKKLTGSLKYPADRIVNISSINQFLIQCDIIKGSYINGATFPVLYSFNPAVAPGFQINERPLVPIYMPITTHRIDNIRIWITDQTNRLLNLRGEQVTLRLHLRKCI
jgi:hypothetical protein